MLTYEEKKVRIGLMILEAASSFLGFALVVYAAGWIAGAGVFLSAFACNIKTRELFRSAQGK